MADADAPGVAAELIQPAQLEGAERQAAEPSQSPPEAERVQYCCGEQACDTGLCHTSAGP